MLGFLSLECINHVYMQACVYECHKWPDLHSRFGSKFKLVIAKNREWRNRSAFLM